MEPAGRPACAYGSAVDRNDQPPSGDEARPQTVKARRTVDRLRGRGDVAMTTDEILGLTRGDD